MTTYEVALLVLMAFLICALVFRDMKIKGQIEAMELTIDLQQKTIDELTKIDAAQERHLAALDDSIAMIRRNHEKLDEQTTRAAARFQSQLEGVPAAQKIRSDVDRLLKADMMRRSRHYSSSDRQYAAEQASPAWGGLGVWLPVDVTPGMSPGEIAEAVTRATQALDKG